MDIQKVLQDMADAGASDLHLKVDRSPIFRLHKELIPQKQYPVLSADEISGILDIIIGKSQRDLFESSNELDCAYVSKTAGRFRVNAFRQRGEIGIVMRVVRDKVPSFRELNLPDVFEEIASFDSGIILVTGKSSSGKSTTVASMVNYINDRKRKHVVTLENPIEYLHTDNMSVINQREIGVDTDSFHTALRHVIREDPDIIVIGEMRDRETIETAISASETGHLVISSFHADDVTQALLRLIEFFPHRERDHVRAQLSNAVRAITCQELIKRDNVTGLVPALEVLIDTPVVAEVIRENRMENLKRIMQQGEHGMRTFNQSLVELVKKKIISRDEALSKSSSAEALKINLKGIYLDEDKGILG